MESSCTRKVVVGGSGDRLYWEACGKRERESLVLGSLRYAGVGIACIGQPAVGGSGHPLDQAACGRWDWGARALGRLRQA